jgi:DnaJ homolog subfamily C member 7
MALKKHRSAIEDCQQAASLQAEDPQPKTLIRLARCQLSLGMTTPATSTLKNVLSITPQTNIRTSPKSEYAQATALLQKTEKLENDVSKFKEAKANKDWSMARLALDQCLTGIEGDIPVEWRIWRVELELGRKKFDDASNAAKSVYMILNFTMLTQ